MIPVLPSAWLPVAKALLWVLALGLIFGAGFLVGKRWEHGANAIAYQQAQAKAEEGRARVAALDREAAMRSANERTKLEARARDLSLRIADAAQKPPPADCRLPVADRWLLNSAIDAANGEDAANGVPAGLPQATAP